MLTLHPELIEANNTEESLAGITGHIEEFFKWVEDIIPMEVIDAHKPLDLTQQYLINWACIWNDPKLVYRPMLLREPVLYTIIASTDKLALIAEIGTDIEYSSNMVYGLEDLTPLEDINSLEE